MSKILSFLKSKKYYLIALVIVGFIVVNLGGGSEAKQQYTVSRMDITEKVAATGKVKAYEEVALGFNASGRISNVSFKVGDRVQVGDVLADLDTQALEADLLKARSALDKEVALLGSESNTAPVTYDNAVKNLMSNIAEAWDSADNSVRNKADQFFTNSTDNPRFEAKIEDGNYIQYFNVDTDEALEVNNLRGEVEVVLDYWQGKEIDTSSREVLITQADKAISDLKLVSNFLSKVALLVNSFTPSDYSYETTVNGYKTLIGGARSDVSSALSIIVTAKDKLNASPVSYNNGFVDIEVQQADVAQARSEVRRIEAMIRDKMIVAPFDGIITKQDAKLGAPVSSGESLIEVLGDNSLYIEANISEVNIGKIKEGNIVEIDFDAFPGEQFIGNVVYIEPGAIVIDGVVNYRVQVEIQNFDPKIKSGLTANMSIITSEASDVLAVPIYAIKRSVDTNTVQKIDNGAVKEIDVNTGIVGDSGFIQIISGLNEGDLIEF